MIVRTDHPRLFLTPTLLTQKKAEMQAGSSRFKELKRLTDAFLTEKALMHVPCRGLMYQLTGDAKYVAPAVRDMLAAASQGTAAISPDSGFHVRDIPIFTALGYDWLFVAMDPADRDTIRTALVQWAAWAWPETNPTRATAWAVNNPGNNYYYGFLAGVALPALALYQDHPDAPHWLDLCVNRWQNQASPYLAQSAAGGYLAEGANYATGSLTSIMRFLLCMRSATNQDLMIRWVDEAIYDKIYQVGPDGKTKCPFGDLAADPKGKLNEYDRAVFGMTAFRGNATGQMARYVLDHMTPNPSQRPEHQWEEFLFWREGVKPIPPTYKMHRAAGAGYVTARSAWAADAIQLHALCGAVMQDHNDYAAGEFTLQRGGDMLVTKAGLHSTSGLAHLADQNNCPLIAGKGQNSAQSVAKLVSATDTGTSVQIEMEAGGAYDWRSGSVWIKPLTAWHRALTFFRNTGMVTLKDRVEKVDASSQTDFLLNFPTAPQQTATGWTVENGASRLLISLTLAPNTMVQVEPVNLGSGGALSSYRLRISPPPGSVVDELLATFKVEPK